MQTHRDDDHRPNAMEDEVREAFGDLEDEAEAMRERRLSTITAGEGGEEVIREWQSNGVLVRQLPERETDENLFEGRHTIEANKVEDHARRRILYDSCIEELARRDAALTPERAVVEV